MPQPRADPAGTAPQDVGDAELGVAETAEIADEIAEITMVSRGARGRTLRAALFPDVA
jgi:hypothetical protein